MSAIRDMLKDTVDPLFNMEDLEFRLYLQDSYHDLINNCTITYLNADDQAEFQYRPRYFLYSKGHPVGGDWVFLWLNGFTGPMDFVNVNKVYIPNWKQLEQMYQRYRTLRTRYKKAKEILMSS